MQICRSGMLPDIERRIANPPYMLTRSLGWRLANPPCASQALHIKMRGEEEFLSTP
jgi:hypothetical protein